MLKLKAEADAQIFEFERFSCAAEIVNIVAALEEGVYIKAWFDTL